MSSFSATLCCLSSGVISAKSAWESCRKNGTLRSSSSGLTPSRVRAGAIELRARQIVPVPVAAAHFFGHRRRDTFFFGHPVDAGEHPAVALVVGQHFFVITDDAAGAHAFAEIRQPCPADAVGQSVQPLLPLTDEAGGMHMLGGS